MVSLGRNHLVSLPRNRLVSLRRNQVVSISEISNQIHRLRELMAKYYVNITMAALENYLTDSVTVHV